MGRRSHRHLSSAFAKVGGGAAKVDQMAVVNQASAAELNCGFNAANLLCFPDVHRDALLTSRPNWSQSMRKMSNACSATVGLPVKTRA